MIYDGINFRHSNKCIVLPYEYYAESGGTKCMVAFGRVCEKGTKNAIRTNRTWRGISPFYDPPEDGEFPIYAVQVKDDGYSLTNMMYGKDGYIYLAKDGGVYVARWKKKQ